MIEALTDQCVQHLVAFSGVVAHTLLPIKKKKLRWRTKRLYCVSVLQKHGIATWQTVWKTTNGNNPYLHVYEPWSVEEK